MVLLAGGVLAVGLLIAVGNAVNPRPDDENATLPSARSSARATASGSATPVQRSLGLMVVAPGEPPLVGDPAGAYWAGWIRPRQDLEILEGPFDDAPFIRRFAAGEIAFASTFPQSGETTDGDWLFVQDPGPPGWVRVARDGTALADRYTADATSHVADSWSMIGGSEGFVAVGNVGDPRYTNGAWIARSGAGTHWSGPDGALPAGFGQLWVADGPAGWLALSSPWPLGGRSSVWLSASAEGAQWTTLGALGFELHNLYPDALYGADVGYLLANLDGAWRQYWFSSDGRTWLEMPRPDFQTPFTEFREAAAPIGFYVWDGDGRHGGTGAFTGDGGRWVSTDVGPTGSSSEVVGLGDALLGLDSDPDGSGVRVWLGRPQPDAFEWNRDAAAEATLAGSAPVLLVADGRRAVAVTVDLDTERVRAWSTPDGHDWRPLAMPDGGFGVIPHKAASSRSAILLVGREDRAGMQLPVLWRLIGDIWDSLPFAEVVPFPIPTTACPDVPTDALEFLALNQGLAAWCFGDRPISFPAYVAPYRASPTENSGITPEWLAAGGGSWISLSPYATDSNSGAQAALAPTAIAPAGAGPGWFNVTGHFNDPASDSCRQAWDLDTVAWYPGRDAVVQECRETFVVSEITPPPDR
jgi:hypothetical protein